MKQQTLEVERPALRRSRLRHCNLRRGLEKLTDHESRFCEAFYDLFFARCPEALPLFGVHSIAEREEMIHETFRSLFAYCEGEPWLDENLVALGRSHDEYGVTGAMYDAYCDVLIDCSRAFLGEKLEDSECAALRLAIVEIVLRMRRGP